MHEPDYQQQMGELINHLSGLPGPQREHLEKLADETRRRHEKLRQTVGALQDSLDQLRLSVKYLVFDLEATRRENEYLRKMLEQQNGGSDNH